MSPRVDTETSPAALPSCSALVVSSRVGVRRMRHEADLCRAEPLVRWRGRWHIALSVAVEARWLEVSRAESKHSSIAVATVPVLAR